MRDHGGYDHQKQTYRIITMLERRYRQFPGLNLTYEVRLSNTTPTMTLSMPEITNRINGAHLSVS